MNYQAIRAKFEGPVLTAFNNQTPPVPVYFDNITSVPPDPPNEYVRINFAFGLTTESTLTESLDHARGAIVVRCFTQKDTGPARCQEMIALAKSVIDSINSSHKTQNSVYLRIGQITGPSFDLPDTSGHFIGRIEMSWQAMAV